MQKFYFTADTLQTRVCSVFTIKLELEWSSHISHQQCQSDWKYHHLVRMWKTKRWMKTQYQIWASQRKVIWTSIAQSSEARKGQPSKMHFCCVHHWWCHCVWRNCNWCWTPLQLDCFINPVQWWIGSTYLPITAKSWSYRIQEKDEDAGESKVDCYEVQEA